ncbi:hypothetical protein A2715_04805 [Candidatus Woesebacteria bacterium RIFCSPHIGHO2_01_FULL_39_32]|uniref:Pyridoxamine 5'-phosphate oxidase N-terminal domain-containing protein n=1 Tax=Candidatus Woesebacteria bacterium RIFCSPLOWO2_01_FULL_39_25 TaxID=1802521 RepID=A0A1F8BMH3_9BACT|nr:MAG: hypothetical protein A2124_03345 [Candidatus Woesebacteria bacterium GWB1_37_5]OGM25338.1 MAG: hypothetical protein A2715_04805 [Candidatus Woesebacteria bacterium RIFCSPHIGHO2_01_FULL_39_32]OGM37837.1 MAG: hypothetical protein A3F01_02015 [Candidatus Woesebacteria bacterium RIFCSPHIGHO2_12_FULL_38_11]OGM64869.1 MAG: hypothetical protein A2893_04415 [Candidatus Woesebacteria bacterium RIFCSPLOWO2_01_FULL_39_25]
MDNKDKEKLEKFLNANNLMTLATANPKPWVATVYYAFDKGFNLYFVSSPNSKHSHDIEKNKNVAIAIYDSHTKNSESKTGLQLQGVASRIKGWDMTTKMLKIWHKSAPGMEDIVNIKNMKAKVISSRVYKITPTIIKFFNQDLYGEEGYRVFKL